MSTHTLQAGELTLVAECDDALAEQARSVLDTFKRLRDEGRELRDGFRVEFGWAPLTLRARAERRVVCEPDFAGDPLRDVREEITVTVGVLAQQAALLNRLGVEGEAASFRQRLVVGRGAVETPRVYLERKEPAGPEDTGWYLGPVEDAEGEPEYESLRVYELLTRRAPLVQALALPRGFLVVFDGDQIEAVMSDENENVWDGGAEGDGYGGGANGGQGT